MKLVGGLAARSPGLRLVLARQIKRHCRADEILQGRLIDLVAFLAYLQPKQPALHSQTRRRVACGRCQKKYESPQSTPVVAAQPHASGPSPT